MRKATDPISELFQRYQKYAHDKDSGGMISLYHENVRVFDLWNAWCVSGKEQWFKDICDWFSSLNEESVVVDFEDIEIRMDTELATASAYVLYKAVDGDGKELRKMKNRLSWSLCKDDDCWRIFHQHTSLPIDGDTVQPIFG